MIKRIFLFLFLFSPFLYLQDTNSWVIDDIRLSGLQRVSAGSVFAVMPVGLGDEINKEMFKEIAKVSNISTKENISELPASATFVVNQLSLNIPLVDVIDKNSEIKRLTKNISKLEKALESVSGRLKNKNYLANAPENIVKKEKDLHASQLNEITKLKKQLKVLEEI